MSHEKLFARTVNSAGRFTFILLFVCVAGAYAVCGQSTIAENDETYRRALPVFARLLKSEPAAITHLSRLRVYATDTGYLYAPLVNVSQRLIVSGLKSDQSEATISVCGDAAAVLDRSDETLVRLVLIFGQMRSRQVKADTGLYALTELGLPAMELLAKATGVTADKLEKLLNEGRINAPGAAEGILAMCRLEYTGLAVMTRP